MLFIINLLFTWFLNDLDISGKQVVYICFKIVLERNFQMFYHETFWNVKKNLVFSWIISALSKELCGTLRNLEEISRIKIYESLG